MKIYDISQEVFACQVYPGDPKPSKELLKSIESGDLYNLTSFSMCAHNGTHIDAPFHFFRDGATVDGISLESFVGIAYVTEYSGVLTKEGAEAIIKKAKAQNPDAARRILIKGDVEISLEAAEVFAASELLLLGCESQSTGPEDAPMEVHKVLLGADVVLLEGVRLSDVPNDTYLLSAAPLNLSGVDGAPTRAILIKMG